MWSEMDGGREVGKETREGKLGEGERARLEGERERRKGVWEREERRETREGLNLQKPKYSEH